MGICSSFTSSSLPNIVNVNLNKSTGVRGGSNAIYGVDGSPVVHDMYFRSPLDTAKAWHNINGSIWGIATA